MFYIKEMKVHQQFTIYRAAFIPTLIFSLTLALISGHLQINKKFSITVIL